MKKKKIEKDVLENIRWFIKFPLEKRLRFANRINELLKLKKLGFSPGDAGKMVLQNKKILIKKGVIK